MDYYSCKMDSSRDSSPSTVRKCPGLGGKSCGRFMANFEVDSHPTCSRCSGRSCSQEMPCVVCLSWSAETWARFSARKVYRRKHSSTDLSSSLPPPPPLEVGPPSVFSALSRRVDALQSSISSLPAMQQDMAAMLDFFRGFAQQQQQQQPAVADVVLPVPSRGSAAMAPPLPEDPSRRAHGVSRSIDIAPAAGARSDAFATTSGLDSGTPLLDERELFAQVVSSDGSFLPCTPKRVEKPYSQVASSELLPVDFMSPSLDAVDPRVIMGLCRDRSPIVSSDRFEERLEHVMQQGLQQPFPSKPEGVKIVASSQPATKSDDRESRDNRDSRDNRNSSERLRDRDRRGQDRGHHDRDSRERVQRDHGERDQREHHSSRSTDRHRSGSTGSGHRSPPTKKAANWDRVKSSSRVTQPSGPSGSQDPLQSDRSSKPSKTSRDTQAPIFTTKSSDHRDPSTASHRSSRSDPPATIAASKASSTRSERSNSPHHSTRSDVKVSPPVDTVDQQESLRQQSVKSSSEMGSPTRNRLRAALDFSRMSEAEQIEQSFLQVQSWTQRSFPDKIPEFVAPQRTYSSFAESQLDKSTDRKQIPLLPWCDGIHNTAKVVQDSTRPPGLPALKATSSLPPPSSQMRFYRVLGKERAAQPSLLNEQLASLTVDSSKAIKPNFTTSEEDIKQSETSIRRALMVQSTLDWHVATCAKLVSQMIDEDALENPDEPSRGLEAVRRVMLSVSKCVSQLIRESTTSLANTILHRRDGYLKALPKTLPDSSRQDLRLNNLFAETLFDEATLKTVLEKSRQDANHSSNLKMGQLVTKLAQPTKTSTQPKKQPAVYATDIPKGGSYRGGRKAPQNQSSRKTDYKPSGGRGHQQTDSKSKVFAKGSPRGGGRGGPRADRH